jgi:hypothetical protein
MKKTGGRKSRDRVTLSCCHFGTKSPATCFRTLGPVCGAGHHGSSRMLLCGHGGPIRTAVGACQQRLVRRADHGVLPVVEGSFASILDGGQASELMAAMQKLWLLKEKHFFIYHFLQRLPKEARILLAHDNLTDTRKQAEKDGLMARLMRQT